MITKVTVTFDLEHLSPLDDDVIDERLQELLIPETVDYWINEAGYYAILKDQTLEVRVNADDQD